MEFWDYIYAFVGPLAGSVPGLLFWIAVIVLAAVLLRRGGGRGERFVITGAGLKIVAKLLGVPLAFLPVWLRRGHDAGFADLVTTIGSGFINVIAMIGIICLLYAFWVKFREKQGTASLRSQ